MAPGILAPPEWTDGFRGIIDLTRRAPGFYPVIEEIVEGFVEGF